jgi:hypothetical protein
LEIPITFGRAKHGNISATVAVEVERRAFGEICDIDVGKIISARMQVGGSRAENRARRVFSQKLKTY